MKEFIKLLKEKHGKELDDLQKVANISDEAKEYSNQWDGFVTEKIMYILVDDDDLMEKFIHASLNTLVAELAIKPDPEYKPTKKKEKAIDAFAELLIALDINLEDILK